MCRKVFLAAALVAGWAFPGPGLEAAAPLAVGDFGPGMARPGGEQPALSDAEARALFEQVRRLILDGHTDRSLSEADLMVAAARGMLDLLNDRAPRRRGDSEGVLDGNGLVDADGIADVEELARGEKTGIGVEFQPQGPDGGELLVQRVFPGSPAARTGIQRGDRIVSVDGHPLRGTRLEESLALLRGRSGTPVHLGVQRPGTRSGFRVTLTRAPYRVRSVAVDHPTPGLARLHVSHFHGRTAAEIEEALAQLGAAEIGRAVLDLRNNQGGLLQAAADAAALFLPPGRLVGRVEDVSGDGWDLTGPRGGRFTGRLVCLVNRFTSAGAEMVAAALQDSGRAGVVGERTMGKATLDTVSRLRAGLAVRMTTLRYLRVDGGTWEGRGIVPDVVVEGPAGAVLAAGGIDDPALRTAVHLLEGEDAEAWVVPPAPARVQPVRAGP